MTVEHQYNYDWHEKTENLGERPASGPFSSKSPMWTAQRLNPGSCGKKVASELWHTYVVRNGHKSTESLKFQI
jgi:hypothetical protein